MKAVGVMPPAEVKPKPKIVIGADPLIPPLNSDVLETAGASNVKLPKPVPARDAIKTPVDLRAPLPSVPCRQTTLDVELQAVVKQGRVS
jgi:hypothetical protein